MFCLTWLSLIPIFISIATPESICQLTECVLLKKSKVKVQPQQFPPCLAIPYPADVMWPLASRKALLSEQADHFFDLYHNDSQPCGFLMLTVSFPSMTLTFGCYQFSQRSFLYDVQDRLIGGRCFKKYEHDAEAAKTCHYHAREQLRLTVLDNDTVLVEDLSRWVRPGVRMWFRLDDWRPKQHCACRNLRRDVAKYDECEVLMERKQQLAVELKLRLIREFRIGLSLVVLACGITVLGWFWATIPKEPGTFGCRGRVRRIHNWTVSSVRAGTA